MKLAGKMGLLIAAMAIWATSSSAAHAQVGGAPYALGYGFFGNGLYGLMNSSPPPYYAIFPPVYYSYPVGRPYGYSPFAYPPGYITPEGEPIQAKEIANPFVPRKPASKTADRTAAAPKVILNPFVKPRAPTALAARPASDVSPQSDRIE